MVKRIILVLEILTVAAAIVVACLWIFDPSGQYEPTLALIAGFTGACELLRRYLTEPNNNGYPDALKSSLNQSLGERGSLPETKQRVDSISITALLKNLLVTCAYIFIGLLLWKHTVPVADAVLMGFGYAHSLQAWDIYDFIESDFFLAPIAFLVSQMGLRGRLPWTGAIIGSRISPRKSTGRDRPPPNSFTFAHWVMVIAFSILGLTQEKMSSEEFLLFCFLLSASSHAAFLVKIRLEN